STVCRFACAFGLLSSYCVLLLFFLFLHILSFFFFNVPATTEIYTLSLHDALPISLGALLGGRPEPHHTRAVRGAGGVPPGDFAQDRKSTRLNSSHVKISYAVFCLKKKKEIS